MRRTFIVLAALCVTLLTASTSDAGIFCRRSRCLVQRPCPTQQPECCPAMAAAPCDPSTSQELLDRIDKLQRNVEILKDQLKNSVPPLHEQAE
jgi:hypothetical protein